MLPLISAVSEILSVLKNPTRLRILFFLSQGGKTYSDLMHEVTEDSGKFAFHLRSMRDFFIVEGGIYSLSPLGERLYKFFEGMEEVLMVVYVRPSLEIFINKDGSAKAMVEAEYNSPSKSILAEVFSYVGPAKSFIELFIEKKTSQMFECKTKLHIESIDYSEGKLKAQATLEIERYARKNKAWKIHYTPSAILSEIQNVPWDVEGNVSIIIHLPEHAKLIKGMGDNEFCGEGYSFSFRSEIENATVRISLHVSKRKGILIPQDVMENILLDLEYEVIE